VEKRRFSRILCGFLEMEPSKDRKNRIPAGVGGPKTAHSASVGASVALVRQRQRPMVDRQYEDAEHERGRSRLYWLMS
jgi:hypothetical protein